MIVKFLDDRTNFADDKVVLLVFGDKIDNSLSLVDGNRFAVDDYVDITVAADEQEAIGGHYGGDYFIMKDLVKFLNGLPTSSSTTVIEDSVNGHLVCYAAEISRKEKRVVDLNEEFGI